jgi:hypothetical protein
VDEVDGCGSLIVGGVGAAKRVGESGVRVGFSYTELCI